MSRQREQKLGAVYDAFEAKNYKGALKLASAAVQKYPDQWVFRSLKAVALERTGKLDEAMQLVEQVLAAAPPDEHVLNMLLLVLKPANKVEALAAAYEAACNKAPGDETLLQGLFSCHVRSFRFREQQMVAMKLNKQHPSERYQWWVVCSLALQAHAAAVQAQRAAAAAEDNNANSEIEQAAAVPGSSAGLGADKLLQLAEAMAARLLSKQGAAAADGQNSWEAVMLYLGLLQSQGKHDTALAALRGPLAAAISLPAERREAEAALLLSKGDLPAAALLYQEAVQEQPDDWALLLLYFDCLLPSTAETLPAISSTAVAQMLSGAEATTMADLQSGGLAAAMAQLHADDSDSPPLQDRLAQAEAFINSLPKTATAATAVANGAQGTSDPTSRGPLLRGPALAAVELAKRKLLLGQGEQQLVGAILQYHASLGHVVSCSMDVRNYLPLLTGAALAQQLQQQADEAAAQLQQQVGDKTQQLHLLRRQMAARQIHADLGGPRFDTAVAAQKHAQHLMTLYAAALPFYNGLDERERGPADELLWLAAAALVKAAALEQQQQQGTVGNSSSSSSGIGHMITAILVLEAAVKGRPYCAPARLGLTALYGLLGNTRAAAHHFAALDIKHIQHDTLSSQHLLPLLLGLGAHAATEGLLQSILALFEDHMRDAGDTLMQAYTTGSYTKVLEFVCFKERLEQSHSYALARAEKQLLAITKAATAAGPEQTRAAAVAGATALPLQLLNTSDWQGMRFNEDLTTRLPWLPPVAGPRHLMVLLWWEQQLQQQCDCSSKSAVQSCWWQRVAAAEADLPQAAQLRAAMRAAVQQRWLQPHLLAAALQIGYSRDSSSSSSSGGAASAASQHQQGTSLLDLLVPFAAALGCSSVAALNHELSSCFGGQQQQGDSSGSSVGASRQLQLLTAALFLLAAAMQDVLVNAHSEPADAAARTEAHDTMSHRASWLTAGLQQLQQQFCVALDSSSAHKRCLLAGHTLSLGVLLTSECCGWLLVCLEAWSKTVQQVRGTKKSKKQPVPTSCSVAAGVQDESMNQTLKDLSGLQAQLTSSLEAVRLQTGKILAVPAGDLETQLLAECDPSSNTGLQTLVGWEQSASVQPVLVDLVRSQRQVLLQIDNVAKGLIHRATHVSW